MATEKKEMRIEDFLNDIDQNFADVVLATHNTLMEQGCLLKLQEAKSGHVVSYNHPKTKKVVANFVSRKSGPVVRIYGDSSPGYLDLLNTIPPELEKLVAKAPACKRMLDPTKCNARCAMGYDITINGARHQKCRYSCFMFPLTGETQPYIQQLLQRELEERSRG